MPILGLHLFKFSFMLIKLPSYLFYLFILVRVTKHKEKMYCVLNVYEQLQILFDFGFFCNSCFGRNLNQSLPKRAN